MSDGENYLISAMLWTGLLFVHVSESIFIPDTVENKQAAALAFAKETWSPKGGEWNRHRPFPPAKSANKYFNYRAARVG